MPYTKTEVGIQIHYFISHGNPTLFFIHGWPMNMTLWHKQIKKYTGKKLGIVAIDLRGHGLSGKPQSSAHYTFKKYCEDILSVIREESLRNIILVGHSMGGMVALEFQKKYPEKVSGMILIDTTYKNPGRLYGIKTDKDYKEYYEEIEKKIPEVKEETLLPVDYAHYKDRSDLYYWALGVKSTPRNVVIQDLKEILKFDVEENLEKINVPVLIISGSDDWLMPSKESKMMHEKINKSELKFILKAKHDVMLTHAEELNKYIDEFLEKHFQISPEGNELKK